MNESLGVNINIIDKILKEDYNAKEVDKNNLYFLSSYVDSNNKNIFKVYIIDDKNLINTLLTDNEKKEILNTKEFLLSIENDLESSNDEDKNIRIAISTGNLILIILESTDKIHLSGFEIEGYCENLYNKLLSFSDKNNLNVVKNPMDDIIDDLKKFKPYGPYM